ncbi:MAG: hypothetical protein ACLR0U_27605 [Enterocloster clostridioformis]
MRAQDRGRLDSKAWATSQPGPMRERGAASVAGAGRELHGPIFIYNVVIVKWCGRSGENDIELS